MPTARLTFDVVEVAAADQRPHPAGVVDRQPARPTGSLARFNVPYTALYAARCASMSMLVVHAQTAAERGLLAVVAHEDPPDVVNDVLGARLGGDDLRAPDSSCATM